MTPRRALGVGGLLLALAGAGVGCAAEAQPTGQDPATSSAQAGRPASDGEPDDVPEAREGSVAASQRVTFVPRAVTLPGGSAADVLPASTVRGELVVPENARHVGWWDGSASVGDPFGTTVIAGHVDSATTGLGYFARLLSISPGERITLGAGPHRLAYKITSVETVTKQTLATSGEIFDQVGPHRLVLITCTGAYRPGRGYDSNLIVTARPLGLPR